MDHARISVLTPEEVMMNMRLTKKLNLSYVDSIPGDRLKIIYQNVRSLNKNFNHILAHQWYNQANVLIFSETGSLCTDKFHIDGYRTAFRLDNKKLRKPRGIIGFVKKNIVSTVLDQCFQDIKNKHHTTSMDLILLQVNDIKILTGYKSPTVHEKIFVSQLKKSNLNNPLDSYIIIGDFNIDVFQNESSFEICLKRLQFSRAIDPAISTTNFNTQIDIIFVNDKITFYKAGVYESIFSDHKPIFIGINNDKFNIEVDTNCSQQKQTMPTFGNKQLLRVEQTHQLHSAAIETIDDNITSVKNTNFVYQGLINADGVSCYAISAVLSLLNCHTLEKQYVNHHDDLMKHIMDQYMEKRLDISSIRCLVNSKYSLQEQQDVAEFLMDLYPLSLVLQNAVMHQLKINRKCTNCGQYDHSEIHQNFIAPLTLPPIRSDNVNETCTYDFETLFHNNYVQEQISNLSCHHCNTNLKETNVIDASHANEVIILQLMCFTYCQKTKTVHKIHNVQINQIDHPVDIGQYDYKISSIIVHEGESTKNGHYYILVDNSINWIKISDSAV